MSEPEEIKFINKLTAAAEKGKIKTLDAVHMDYMRMSGLSSPKSTVHRHAVIVAYTVICAVEK